MQPLSNSPKLPRPICGVNINCFIFVSAIPPWFYYFCWKIITTNCPHYIFYLRGKKLRSCTENGDVAPKTFLLYWNSIPGNYYFRDIYDHDNPNGNIRIIAVSTHYPLPMKTTEKEIVPFGQSRLTLLLICTPFSRVINLNYTNSHFCQVQMTTPRISSETSTGGQAGSREETMR